jgi:hypothetical protein
LKAIEKNEQNILCLIIEFHNLRDNLKTIKNFYKKTNLISCNICPNNSSETYINGDPKTIEVTFVNKKFLYRNYIKKSFVSKCYNNNPYKKKIFLKFK